MKSILSVFFLICGFAAGAQILAKPMNPSATTLVNLPASSAETLQILQTEHDFGKIPQGKPVYYTFEIVNAGTEAFGLENVQASCGCTTPEWTKDPIPVGGKSQIRVGYNAATPGDFDKHITITYLNGQTRIIQIKGNVWKAPEGSAPANASVQFLKKQTL